LHDFIRFLEDTTKGYIRMWTSSNIDSVLEIGSEGSL